MIERDKPYMDKPKKKEQVKDQLIYGDGETLGEKKKKKKKYKDEMLNEDQFTMKQPSDIIKEKIVNVPIIKVTKVKFAKPVRLKFYSVEDKNGFIKEK